MADIKTRDAVKGTIKTIDKAAIATERMKSAYAKTKDKAKQGCYTDESSATEYAADRLSYGADRIKDEGIHQFNKQGQKAVKETRENIGKAKDKISSYKQKKAAKAAEQNNNRRRLDCRRDYNCYLSDCLDCRLGVRHFLFGRGLWKRYDNAECCPRNQCRIRYPS